MNNKEKRYFNLNTDDLKMRVLKDEKTGQNKIVGYGSVFNHKSRLIYEVINNETKEERLFFEIIEPGAFDRVLQDNNLDVVLSVNHDFEKILGRTISGTLKLFTDEKGLRYECILPNTNLGRDVAEMVQRGDYYESSFNFTISRNENEGFRWEKDEDGEWLRYVSNVTGLYDVTIATYHGAYSNTDVEVAVRTLKEHIEKETPDNTEKREETTENTNDYNEVEKLDLEIFMLNNSN
ncbi:MAG: HK97 family phage prohead protease [bacterium]